MLGLSSSGKKVLANPLDAAAISALPAHTAPYPANSSPGMDGDEKRRLMENDGKVWPMVMSVGYNPYFKNEKVTAVSSIVAQQGMIKRADGAGSAYNTLVPERLLRTRHVCLGSRLHQARARLRFQRYATLQSRYRDMNANAGRGTH